LIRFRLWMRDIDKQVVVTNISPLVVEVFHITKSDVLANIHA